MSLALNWPDRQAVLGRLALERGLPRFHHHFQACYKDRNLIRHWITFLSFRWTWLKGRPIRPRCKKKPGRSRAVPPDAPRLRAALRRRFKKNQSDDTLWQTDRTLREKLWAASDDRRKRQQSVI